MTAGAPSRCDVDDVRSVAKLGGLAARRLLERCDAAAAAALGRAFKRDVTVLEFRAGGLDLLDVPHRSERRRPVQHLPGRVAVVGPTSTYDREREVRAADVEPFLVAGGTVVVETTGLPSFGEREPPGAPAGPVAVRGAFVAGLADAGLSPTFWIDADARALVSKRGGREVLVETRDGAPLVTRIRRARGSVVHFASEAVPFRREVSKELERVTPAHLAERLRLPREGAFDDADTTMPEPLLVAETTMLFVVARVLAAAVA